MRQAWTYVRCWWAKHFGPKEMRDLVLYPHEFRKRYINPAMQFYFAEVDFHFGFDEAAKKQ